MALVAMRVVVLHTRTKLEVRMPCRFYLEDMAHDVCEH